VARLARGDINMPNLDGFPVLSQVADIKFEVAAYELLRSKPNVPVSRLLYHRIPLEQNGPRLNIPSDITGRRLLVFEKAEGGNVKWSSISQEERVRAHFHFRLLANLTKCCSGGFVRFCTVGAQIRIYDFVGDMRASMATHLVSF